MYLYINIKNNFKEIFIFIKLIIILLFLSFKIYRILNIKFITSYIKLKNEFYKIERIFNLCYNKYKLKKYKKIQNPKISVISPIYNRGRYILRFLKSIQYQNFNDLEIIFVDDCSKDNSFNLIKEYQKKEKRIKLIKNLIIKGTFISRNLGVQYSIGRYVILLDTDDILSNNILNLCYSYALKYDIEVIRFKRFIKRKKKLIFNTIVNNLEIEHIYQPELSSYMYYGNNNELGINDWNINNKFIKREVYIKSLNTLENLYLNIYITFMEDAMINFIISITAQSFLFIKTIGYYYIKNSESITKNINKI